LRTGCAASRGALAPQPPRATHSQPESIGIIRGKKRKKGENLEKRCFGGKSVCTLADCKWPVAAAGLNPLRLPCARFGADPAGG